MVPLDILPMVPLVATSTIGNQRALNVSRQPMVHVPLVPMLPLLETLVPLVVPMLLCQHIHILVAIPRNSSSIGLDLLLEKKLFLSQSRRQFQLQLQSTSTSIGVLVKFH